MTQSAYEKDRIIKDDFGKTEMGRDLLAEDYILKQITASLIYPEGNLGKKFWDKVYSQAQEQFGSTNIPVNTFNKVWIVPDDALVYEKGNTCYVISFHLKVMLEEDYLSLQKHSRIQTQGTGNKTHSIASNIVRQIVLPELEKEINEGKNFATLRQVFSGVILAAWFKRALKESLLGKMYANKGKVKGVDQDPKTNEEIYHRYLRAYKKGVFNYIKEDVDKYTNEVIPRKYFSGGTVVMSPAMKAPRLASPAQLATDLGLNLNKLDNASAAMTTPEELRRTANAAMSQPFLDAGESYRGDPRTPNDRLWDLFRYGKHDLGGKYIRDAQEAPSSYANIFNELWPSFGNFENDVREAVLEQKIHEVFSDLYSELAGKSPSYKVYGTDKTIASLTGQDYLDIMKARVLDSSLRPGDLILKNILRNSKKSSIGFLSAGHYYLFQMIDLWAMENSGHNMNFLADRVERIVNGTWQSREANPGETKADNDDKIGSNIAYYYVGRNGYVASDPKHTEEEIRLIIAYIRNYGADEKQRIHELLSSGEILKQELLDLIGDPNIVEKAYIGYQTLKSQKLSDDDMKQGIRNLAKELYNGVTNFDNVNRYYSDEFDEILWKHYQPSTPTLSQFDPKASLAMTTSTTEGLRVLNGTNNQFDQFVDNLKSLVDRLNKILPEQVSVAKNADLESVVGKWAQEEKPNLEKLKAEGKDYFDLSNGEDFPETYGAIASHLNAVFNALSQTIDSTYIKTNLLNSTIILRRDIGYLKILVDDAKVVDQSGAAMTAMSPENPVARKRAEAIQEALRRRGFPVDGIRETAKGRWSVTLSFRLHTSSSVDNTDLLSSISSVTELPENVLSIEHSALRETVLMYEVSFPVNIEPPFVTTGQTKVTAAEIIDGIMNQRKTIDLFDIYTTNQKQLYTHLFSRIQHAANFEELFLLIKLARAFDEIKASSETGSFSLAALEYVAWDKAISLGANPSSRERFIEQTYIANEIDMKEFLKGMSMQNVPAVGLWGGALVFMPRGHGATWREIQQQIEYNNDAFARKLISQARSSRRIIEAPKPDGMSHLLNYYLDLRKLVIPCHVVIGEFNNSNVYVTGFESYDDIDRRFSGVDVGSPDDGSRTPLDKDALRNIIEAEARVPAGQSLKGRLIFKSSGKQVARELNQIVVNRSSAGTESVTGKDDGGNKITVYKWDIVAFEPSVSLAMRTNIPSVALQRSTPVHQRNSARPFGGIDFNSANLNLRIKRDGNGVPLPVSQQDMAQLAQVDGLVPVILKITPENASPLLSELQPLGAEPAKI